MGLIQDENTHFNNNMQPGERARRAGCINARELISTGSLSLVSLIKTKLSQVARVINLDLKTVQSSSLAKFPQRKTGALNAYARENSPKEH